MPFSPKIKTALDHFRRAFAAGRMPHALVVSGHPRGAGETFVEGLLGLLFNEEDPTRLRRHVDIRWLEPESKSRQIRADEGRSLIDFIGLTSYEGGWKAGVILFADRMNATAQNILLKTLEEPPPKSFLVLVTDSPASLLPTIRSRAQFVDVAEAARPSAAPWYPAVLELLRNPPLRRGSEMLAWSDQLTKPLRELEALAKEEEARAAEASEEADATPAKVGKDVVEGRIAARVREMREEILRTIQLWQRDVLACSRQAEHPPLNFPEDAETIAAQAQGLSFADAAKRVAVVDEVRHLLEHNIRDSVVIPRMARAFSILP
ncbi:MAG: hypothetical protein LBN38_06495 [Verrucomicrobiota bacterium]|jgi:DNA polymerase III delta prime subunit|nr:hypothetical protein [Verrucomicrobiota bacterium]